MIWLYIFIFISSCTILFWAGKLLVESLTKMAHFLGWREFVVASVLMAFVTSLPELFIGVFSAFHKRPQFSFGVIIGSNIIALTLIVGIGSLIAKQLRFGSKILQRSSLYTAAIAPLPFLLMLDGRISRWDGIVLFLAFGFYFHRLLSQEERFTKILASSLRKDRVGFELFLKDLKVFFGGVCLLFLSAEGIVFSALGLIEIFNLPLLIVGIFLVALGTSLPEMAFTIESITMGHKEMILGDVMGSVVVNSTLIWGLIALISPFEISVFSPYLIGILFTVIIALSFAIFARTDRKISKREGIILLSLYVLFVISELFLT